MIKGILFNTDMVRAILEGRKTVTRRVIEPTEENYGIFNHNSNEHKPPYQPGDILYVRERIRLIDFQYIDDDWSASIEYFADNGMGKRLRNLSPDEKINWRPSIHMPKEAARIWLKVTDVRVERLQDITEKDAISEGITDDMAYSVNGWKPTFYDPDSGGDPEYIKAFSYLWDSTIKKKDLSVYGWDASPWVWVIEFEQCEKPKEA